MSPPSTPSNSASDKIEFGEYSTLEFYVMSYRRLNVIIDMIRNRMGKGCGEQRTRSACSPINGAKVYPERWSEGNCISDFLSNYCRQFEKDKLIVAFFLSSSIFYFGHLSNKITSEKLGESTMETKRPTTHLSLSICINMLRVSLLLSSCQCNKRTEQKW